ncbi:HAD family hydrolase [Sphingomonas sp. DG1-23]|uniref:HAD family hydrolase n=1 Tax=Sphingomonas sp. DG1-23 TaxID=3068316 RepID=UPI00273D3602|nr:HAD family hydrolase [Sphingomonas sp. DG1-23]MDP5278687.1 HAD family hydrolase [Sphingomonas sp. DG1-23]
MVSAEAACRGATLPVIAAGRRDRAIDHVIFDLDGTILDNSRTMRRAFDEAFQECGGIGDSPFPELVSRQGQPFGMILEQLGLPLAMEPAFSRLSRRYVDLTCPAKGIGEVLADLQNAGVSLSIASGKSRSRARWVLEHFDLLKYFHRIIGSDDVANGKPAPDMVLRCIGEAGIAPRDTVMIGDAHADYLAARGAKIRFVLATWFQHANIDDNEIIAVQSPFELRDLALVSVKSC